MNPTKYIDFFQYVRGIASQTRAFIGPRIMQIGLTDSCNLKCEFCEYHTPAKEKHSPDAHSQFYFRKHATLSKTTVFSLLDELSQMHVRRIDYTGIGEPLLHPDLIEILQYTKKKRLNCHLTTNASLLTEERVAILTDLPLDSLRISLNASDPEQYARMMSTEAATFDRVINIAKLIGEIKRKKQAKLPHVTVSFVIHTENVTHIARMAEIVAEIQADACYFGIICPAPHIRDICLSESDLNGFLKQIPDIKLFLERKGIKFTTFGHQVSTGLQKKYACYQGWQFSRVFGDGTISPCCESELEMGNINTHSFREIWNGKPYQEYRKNALMIPTQGYVRGCRCSVCHKVKENKMIADRLRLLNPFF